ncbi:hypothetical protein PsYK624_125330 [Phanerochaete sordida]|uniref:DUF6533 domain-containing protein n=1 Tax=Phanerochaete sordida TaxID=48140 RepID=A0A9P3LJ53_9APHY|nr:hypothetical protein PsYK624_125330 [Phanerochaete sordida]
MSDSSDELVQILRTVQLEGYIGWSLVCLLIYEIVITIDREISTVWRRKFSATSLLLLSTRWLMLVNPVFGAWEGPVVCRPLYLLRGVANLIVTALIALFPTLRVYAFWKDSKIRYLFPTLICVLGLVPVATNSFVLARTAVVYEETPYFSGCAYMTDISPGLTTTCVYVLRDTAAAISVLTLQPTVLYATRCSAIASDLLAIVLTWVRSYRLFIGMRSVQNGTSVTGVLLRDGTVYFGALLVINILQLLSYSTALSSTQISYASSFLIALPPLLMQRFMMNLRTLSGAPGDTRSTSDARHFSRFSVSFRVPVESDFLGNIGEPLAPEGETGSLGWDGEEGLGDGFQDVLEEGLEQKMGGRVGEEAVGRDVEKLGYARSGVDDPDAGAFSFALPDANSQEDFSRGAKAL